MDGNGSFFTVEGQGHISSHSSAPGLQTSAAIDISPTHFPHQQQQAAYSNSSTFSALPAGYSLHPSSPYANDPMATQFSPRHPFSAQASTPASYNPISIAQSPQHPNSFVSYYNHPVNTFAGSAPSPVYPSTFQNRFLSPDQDLLNQSYFTPQSFTEPTMSPTSNASSFSPSYASQIPVGEDEEYYPYSTSPPPDPMTNVSPAQLLQLAISKWAKIKDISEELSNYSAGGSQRLLTREEAEKAFSLAIALSQEIKEIHQITSFVQTDPLQSNKHAYAMMQSVPISNNSPYHSPSSSGNNSAACSPSPSPSPPQLETQNHVLTNSGKRVLLPTPPPPPLVGPPGSSGPIPYGIWMTDANNQNLGMYSQPNNQVGARLSATLPDLNSLDSCSEPSRKKQRNKQPKRKSSASDKKLTCQGCGVSQPSEAWRRGPSGRATDKICNSCGTQYQPVKGIKKEKDEGSASSSLASSQTLSDSGELMTHQQLMGHSPSPSPPM